MDVKRTHQQYSYLQTTQAQILNMITPILLMAIWIYPAKAVNFNTNFIAQINSNYLFIHFNGSKFHFIKSTSMLAKAGPHVESLKTFGYTLLVIEIGLIILFAFFVRYQTTLENDALASQRYPAFQDVNVMMLIGFGFLMTFLKNNCLTALGYTFFINAIVMQLYLLFHTVWERLIKGLSEFQNQPYIEVNQILITQASYCVAAVLISFGGVIGKVGPKELLVLAVIQVIGYALNEVIVNYSIGAFDAGGSMSIHAFGAYFGLTVSLILSSKIKPVARASSSYSSNITALIGTLFLWLYWPSFNFGVAAETQFEQNQIVINTLLSLTGSVLSTFVVTSVAGHGLGMDDILNATLAGGVAVGSASGLLYSPAFALSIGIIAGIISTFGFKYLTPILEHKIGLFDTCGINNLHGIPGVLGGLFSAIIVAAYSWGYDKNVASQYGPHNIFQSVHGSFWHQSLLQVAGTFTSVGFGILFGFIAGKIISVFYRQNPQNFYNDSDYFESSLFVTAKE